MLFLSGLPSSATAPNFPIIEQQSLDLPISPSSQPSQEEQELADPKELEALIDSIVEKEISESIVPGVTVSIVKDGEILFTKGYGYANIEQKIPVDADRTLFRVASLSKLFTATATMQLYEQGLIDLEGDVSNYLDFDLDNPYPDPVTFAQIMTHTDGTTKRRIGLAARTEAELEPLSKHLPNHMPPIVWRPGELYSYSSYSIALLGYLVERISGTSFIQYIDQHILQPLNMQRSTFLQPPPAELADALAVGYQKQGNTFKPVPYLYLNIYPGAAFQATATGMAHFMIAQLQLGRYENQQILQPETAQLMHQTHFKHHPNLPGTGYGFREHFINNIRTIGHLGSLRGYSSSMTLMPDRDIGIFIASNSFSGIHGKILAQFFDRYFPAQDNSDSQPQVNINANHYTGYYRDVEYPRHTLAKISGIFEHIQITKGNNNTLTVQTPSLFFIQKISQRQLVPLDLLLFRRVEDNALTAFGEDEDGNVALAFNPLYPKIGAYERIAWYESVWVQLGLIGFCTLFFLSSCVAWLLRPLIQRWRGKQTQEKEQLTWALRLAGAIGALYLVFLIGLPLYFWSIGIWKLAYGVPPVAVGFLCLPILAVASTVMLPIAILTAWKKGCWSIGRRSHYALVTLATLAFIPFLLYWNLLGFQW